MVFDVLNNPYFEILTKKFIQTRNLIDPHSPTVPPPPSLFSRMRLKEFERRYFKFFEKTKYF